MPPRRIDLHLHTHFSDGTFTPEEVIRRARETGLAAVSITDHDTLAGLPRARQEAGDSLEILSGVELTVAFRARELHILGYGFREDNAELNGFLEEARARRHGRIQAMVDRLNEKGISITLQEVQEAAGSGESIGRPHLAEVLLKKRVVGSLPEAFDRFIGDRAPCFVKQATLTVPEAARLVRGAGGVAVLAHPHHMVQDEWIPELVAQGVQGIEVYHPDHTPSVSQVYRRMAESLNLLITGGSDCHGLRKLGGPFIGSVPVDYELLDRLKAALS